MLIVFEVLVAKTHDADDLLSEELLTETQAQIMTLEQAASIGFSGARPDPNGLEVRLIAVAPRDAQLVQRRLEASDAVQRFRAHQVET